MHDQERDGDGAIGDLAHSETTTATTGPDLSTPPADLAAELARTRDRVAFYESFDTVIQDNIVRSAELLRQAAAEREKATRAASDARLELDRRAAAQGRLWDELGAELAAIQERLAVIAGRLANARDGVVGTPDGGSSATTAAAAPAASTTLIVHGVPRAAAALSLQRHLADLPYVEAVEAREYAAGVLRLQVVARAPLALEDLRRWEGGAGLEPVNTLPDVLEVALPDETP